MASEHVQQQGSKLYYSTDGNTYTEVTEIAAVTVPPLERAGSDDTPLSATLEIDTPGTLESITEATFKYYVHKTLLATLIAFWTGKTNPVYWKMLLPALSSGESTTGSFWLWQGWVSKVKLPDFTLKSTDKVFVEFTIRRTTRPTLTAGS